MKSYEIRKVGPGSVFKFYFFVGVVLGLLTSIILLITRASLKTIGLEFGAFGQGGGPLQVGAAIVGVILASLAYGLITGIISMVGAFIYNGLAAAVGGIVVKLNDRD